MLGVVGRVTGDGGPYPMYARHGRDFMGCKSPVLVWDSKEINIPNGHSD